MKKLQRNDPTVTRVFVGFPYHASYGAALRGNTVVDDLDIDLYSSWWPNDEAFGSLLHWIETSPSLKSIALGKGFTEAVSLFLLAIANNSGIEHVELKSMYRSVDADALASLLRSRRTKLKLLLRDCKEFHPASDDLVSTRVQDALRGNSSLQSLSILNGSFQLLRTLLPALSSCRAITELVLELSSEFRAPARAPSIHALAELLQFPPPNLEHLHLNYFTRTDEGLELVLQRLMQNESIVRLTLERCRFSRSSTELLKNLFRSNSRIHTIAISRLIKFTGPRGFEDTEAILDEFFRSNASLKVLDIADLQHNVFPGESEAQFSRVIKALETNAMLEHLKCGHLDDKRCSVLAESIPKFTGLKELSISFEGNYQFGKEHLLRAFKRNGCLVKVNINQAPNTNYFSEADLRKIAFYTKRNKHVPVMLAASTDEVPLYLRPKLYVAGQAMASGLTTEIFHDLVRLGDKVGKTAGHHRKRERPDDIA